MKFIVLFLVVIASNLHAGVKVSIVNSLKGETYTAKFNTEAEADSWIEKNESNNSWGRKQNYTLTKTDITQEMLDEKQVKLDRISDIRAARSAISNINNSSLPIWHKRLLKRLIREMKE